MSISKIRSLLYKLERLLGDVDAVRKGRIRQRIKNRMKTKIVGKLLRKFIK